MNLTFERFQKLHPPPVNDLHMFLENESQRTIDFTAHPAFHVITKYNDAWYERSEKSPMEWRRIMLSSVDTDIIRGSTRIPGSLCFLRMHPGSLCFVRMHLCVAGTFGWFSVERS